MSQETSVWLNTQTLIGMTDKRGNAWHYRADDQGEESNHYPLAIPVEDVKRRLFNFNLVGRPVYVSVPAGFEDMTAIDDEGRGYKMVQVEGEQKILRDDTWAPFGTFKEGYSTHQYYDWLVKNVATILNDELAISSAGLLKGGAVAWVEVSVPDTIQTPEGFAFRPNLLAATSCDGSVATTYTRTVNATVCDNTLSANLVDNSQKIRIKHSRYSKLKLGMAQEALAMIHTLAEDFAEQIGALAATEVTDKQWSTFLDAHVLPYEAGKQLTWADLKEKGGRSLTMATNKRDGLASMYRNDLRVAPWAGTALGVIQAVNTFVHHEGIVRGTSRQERNMLSTVEGKFDTLDQDTFATLTKVLANA
jgi:phage/plasmid-like protein (TIGR03299 family)